MITKTKLKIFHRNDGDGDIWLRTSWWWQRKKMTPEDWPLIEQLIQDLKLINKGLVATSYAENVYKKIRESCEDESTVKELEILATKM